jgi:hypothetical protein
VTTGQLQLDTALVAAAAKTVAVNVNNAETATFQDVTITAVTSLAVNVSGASAIADFSAINIGGAGGGVTITLGSSTATFSANSLLAGPTATTAAMSTTLSVSNTGSGTVIFAAVDLSTAAATAASAGQVSFAVSANQVGGLFALNGIDLNFIDTASLSFVFAGGGEFDLSAAAAFSATTAQVSIVATAVTGGMVSANFTAWVDTNIITDVRLGNHSAIIALGAGADTVTFGLGSAQFVRGGAGADSLTMSNSAVSFAQYNNTATGAANQDTGDDTIFGASTGDIILFQGYNTGTAAGSRSATATTGILATGVATAVRTATFIGVTTATISSAVASTIASFALYSAAGGDMILEVLLTTGLVSANVVNSGDITRIVLNGKGDIQQSALLRADTNGSGLLFTLL